MLLPRRLRPPIFLLLLFLAAAAQWSAAAQFEPRARIISVISKDFPTLRLIVSVADGEGNLIPDLSAASFRLGEDGALLPPPEVEQLQADIRQVFVINSNPTMARRDPRGTSYFEYARAALLAWWRLPEISVFADDDFTLVTADAALVTHVRSTAILTAALEAAAPASGDHLADLELLQQSLTYSADPAAQAAMPRQLIFLTPLITNSSQITRDNLVVRAQESQTAIHVVLVDSAEAALRPETSLLMGIASATGGSFTILSPDGSLETLARRLDNQRALYQLTTQSFSGSSNEHSLSLLVTVEGVELRAAPAAYQVDLLPPAIAFVNPPLRLERAPRDPEQPLESLQPREASLQVLISFLDSHPRDIVESWLIANGTVVDRRLDPPFDRLNWEISEYLASQDVVLQAGVQDMLGLQNSSAEIRVAIQVPPPPQGLDALRPVYGWLLAGLGVIAAGIATGVSLLNASRRQAASPAAQDPAPAAAPRLQVREPAAARVKQSGEIEAYLVLDDDQDKVIACRGAAHTFGRNPSLVSIPIDDPSVSDLHARLIRLAGGAYSLRDQGSTAGTWVNYEEVPQGGTTLKHADLIHIGRVAFRFLLKDPPPDPEIRILVSPEAAPRGPDDPAP